LGQAEHQVRPLALRHLLVHHDRNLGLFQGPQACPWPSLKTTLFAGLRLVAEAAAPYPIARRRSRRSNP
jgi:hypothetical protein